MAKGAVFGGANAESKTIECGLENPTEWMEEVVTLTLESTDGKSKITCQTNSSAFTCDVTGSGMLTEDPPSVKVTAALTTAVTETTAFRCTVEVGDVDNKATDTKLIYAQKICKLFVGGLYPPTVTKPTPWKLRASSKSHKVRGAG